MSNADHLLSGVGCKWSSFLLEAVETFQFLSEVAEKKSPIVSEWDTYIWDCLILEETENKDMPESESCGEACTNL